MKYELDKNKQFHGIKRFIQIPPPTKFLVDGYQNHHRSPESPQVESLAGF